MTESAVAEKTATNIPLTNPVQGTWLQSPDTSLPPVYVPHEAVYRRDAETGKDVLQGYWPGAHYKRLLQDSWMIVSGPDAPPAVPAPAASAREAALEAELEQMRADMAALRAKAADDFTHVKKPIK